MIERCAPDSSGRLAAIHAAAFDQGWSAESIARSMANGALALATDEGFILVRIAAGEAEILTLAVDPVARRRGLGRALVEAAAKAARQGGAAELFLEVAADNTAALALYLGAGFAEVGRRPAYYARQGGPAMDALVLRRSLPRTA